MVKDIQNSKEYIEFSYWLQNLTTLPPIAHEKEGYFIYHRLSNGHVRRLRLGIFYPKEASDFNLNLYQFQDAQSGILTRPVAPNTRYVLVDNECCLVGIASFLTSQFLSGQRLYRFFANVFTLDVNVARKILKDPTFNPNVIYTPPPPLTGSGSGLGLASLTGSDDTINVTGLTSYFNGQIPIVGDDINGLAITQFCGEVTQTQFPIFSSNSS